MSYIKSGSKYHAQRVEADGLKFASKKEYKRYCELKLLERCGEITNLTFQTPYTIIPKSKYGRAIKYIADFTYYSPTEKRTIVEDTKGFKTDVYKLKKRLLAEKYGIVIKES